MYISSVMVCVWDTTQVARNILSPLDNSLCTFTPKLWVTGYLSFFFWCWVGFFLFVWVFSLLLLFKKSIILTFFYGGVLSVGNVEHD